MTDIYSSFINGFSYAAQNSMDFAFKTVPNAISSGWSVLNSSVETIYKTGIELTSSTFKKVHEIATYCFGSCYCGCLSTSSLTQTSIGFSSQHIQTSSSVATDTLCNRSASSVAETTEENPFNYSGSIAAYPHLTISHEALKAKVSPEELHLLKILWPDTTKSVVDSDLRDSAEEIMNYFCNLKDYDSEELRKFKEDFFKVLVLIKVRQTKQPSDEAQAIELYQHIYPQLTRLENSLDLQLRHDKSRYEADKRNLEAKNAYDQSWKAWKRVVVEKTAIKLILQGRGLTPSIFYTGEEPCLAD